MQIIACGGCSHDTTVGIVTFAKDRTDDPPPPVLFRLEGCLPTCDIIFYDKDRLVTCRHDGRLVSVSRAVAATEGITNDGDGGVLERVTSIPTGNGTFSTVIKMEDGTDRGIVRCV